MAVQKIIVTADDYGVFDEIDNGVIEAVKAGRINSVAAFANYGPEGSISRQKVEKLLEVAKEYERDIQVGIHLTITSGKPITGIDGFEQSCTLKGFRNFMDVEELDKKGKTRLLEELQAQMKVFKGLPVQHITTHHDALTYHIRHFESLLEIASEYDLPVRNYHFDPEKRTKLELISGTDWVSLKKLDRCKEDFETTNQVKIKMPEITYVGQYDAKYNIFWNKVKQKNIYKRASEKRESLENYLKKIAGMEQSKTTEIVSHVIESKIKTQKQYRKLAKKYNYGGVSPAYFDGRLVELYSLNEYDPVPSIDQNLQWGQWRV